MPNVNRRRVWLGGLAGFVPFAIWGALLNVAFLGGRYAKAQQDGFFLQQPRYFFFMPAWFATLLALSWIGAWLYSGLRATWGPGPKTALKIGALLGFAAGFPLSFSAAAWSPAPRIFALCWMVELWLGSVVATLVAGWLYRDN